MKNDHWTASVVGKIHIERRKRDEKERNQGKLYQGKWEADLKNGETMEQFTILKTILNI